MDSCRIGIIGCAGRMGRMLLAEALATPGVELAGGIDSHPGLADADLGELAGLKPIGLAVSNDAESLFGIADVLIDFTRPDATTRHAAIAAGMGKGLVIGTTGLGPADMRTIMEAGERAAIVVAPNMSLGVNLLLGLVEQAARMLGNDWDIEIVEMHHRHKTDAPSGTALGLGRAAAAGRGVTFPEVATLSREGQTGPRAPGSIGFATLRGGDVVGEHTVIFASDSERIELTHKGTDRRIFARGAIQAAQWLRRRPPGIYSMKDVLGLSSAPEVQ